MGGDDDESEMSEDSNARPVGVFQRGMSMSRNKQENKKLESKLKGALGSKSSFAMQELAKIASAEAKAQKDKPRRTLKDIVKENSIGAGPPGARPVHPMFAALKNLKAAQDANAVAVEPEPVPATSPIRELVNMPVTVKKGNKNLHAAVGMFSTMKNQKSGKNLLAGHGASHGTSGSAGNSTGAHASAGNASGPFKEYLAAQAANSAGAVSAASAADVRAINESIHHLQRTVESQNDLIISLFRQVQTMNQSLHIIHPDLPEVAAPAEPALHAQQARRNSNFLGFTLGGKSNDSGASTRDHVGEALQAGEAAVTSPPAPADRRKAFHVNMNMFHHGASSHNSSAHEIEHPVQPALAAMPATHPAAEVVSPSAAATKERRPLFAAMLHATHPAPSAPTHTQPVAHPLEHAAAEAPAEPTLSRPASLAAVHPLPLSVDTAEERPHSLSAVHPMPAKSPAGAAEGQVTRFTPVPDMARSSTALSEGPDSLESMSSLELQDVHDDGSVTLATQAPAATAVTSSNTAPQQGSAAETSRPPSQSRPRKSPLPSRRNFQSNGSQPSSVLGAMGRFTPNKTSIFDESPEGGAPPAVDRGRSSPDLVPAGDALPPVNTSLVMKPQHTEEIPVRPPTRKVTDPPLSKSSDITGNPISEKSDETEEAEGDVVREVRSNLSLLD
jgi:hypothetical protein